MYVWLNGRIVPAARATISVMDRGFLHGDAVYDTWRTYGGTPFLLAAHLRRLRVATRRFGLPPPGDEAIWTERTVNLLRRNRLTDGALRLTITRGTGGALLVPDAITRPTILLTVRPLVADLATQQQRGIAAVLLPFPRNAARPWAGTKLVSQASAVLGRQWAARRRASEGLYVTPEGFVTEGTTSNVFVVRRGRVVTPPTDGSILGGVTRDLVVRLARRAHVPVVERGLRIDDVRSADELFVTASTIEVLPVVRLDGTIIGTGTPGTITRRLQGAYHTSVARALARTRG